MTALKTVKRLLGRGLLLVAVLSWTQTFAQTAPEVSAPGLSILDVTFGARGLALGETMQAVPGDRFSLYNNPATAAFAEQSVVIAGMQNMGIVTSVGMIGLFPIGKVGTFSVGLKGATVDGIEVRDNPDVPLDQVDRTGVVSAVPALSFAYKFSTFSVGVGVRAQTVSLGYNPDPQEGQGDDLTAATIGVDVGAFQDFGKLSMGAVAQNLGPRMYFLGGEADSVGTPQPYYFGASLRYLLFDEKLTLLGGAGYGARGLVITGAAEYSPWRILSLRLGCNTERMADNVLNGLATGFGLQLSNLEINYSYLPNSFFGAGGLHGIDIGFHFGANEAQKERLLAQAREQAAAEALQRQKLTSRSLYEQGLSQYNMSRYDEAMYNWDLALIWWPDNSEAQSMITKVSTEKEEMALKTLVDQAKQAYVSKNYVALVVLTEQVLAEDSAHSLALFYKQEAEKGVTEELITSAPAAVQADLRAGIEALAHQDYLAAMRSFEKVFDYDPGNAAAQQYIRNAQGEIDRYISEELAKVNSLLGRNRYSEAKTLVRELLMLAPQNADLLQKLGEIDSKLNADIQRRLEKAKSAEDAARSEKELKTVLQLDPSNKQAQENLAAVEKAAQKSAADVQKLYLLGVESYSENNYELAISYWQRVLAIDANHANARKNMGRARAKLNALAGT